jgi:Arc/MetJ-type ribon-helix-helix transcriptional regulator
MTEPLTKRLRLEAIRPSLEATEEVMDQIIKHLEAAKPGPGEAKALVERLKHGPPSAADRQRLLEILAAEEAALEFLARWAPPRLPRQRQRHGKRNKQRVKRARRHHRR